MTQPTPYPLCWPQGWPRTPIHEQESGMSRFRRGTYNNPRYWTISEARQGLTKALTSFGADDIVISTDLSRNGDGTIAHRQSRSIDSAIAVYFTLNGRAMHIAQDRFIEPEYNLRSLTLCLEGLMQVKRHGGGPAFDRATRGFAAIEGPRSRRPWRDVLGFKSNIKPDERDIKSQHRKLLIKYHPDRNQGEDTGQKMAEINAAVDEALAEARS